MSFLNVLQIMIRRWTVVLPVLIFVTFAGIALIMSSETRFSIAGTELLVEAAEDGESAGNAGGISADAAGEIVSSAIDQPSFRRQYQQRGLLGTYNISDAVGATVISISIIGNDDDLVLSTAKALIDDASGALAGVVGVESAKGVRVIAVADPTLADVIRAGNQRSLSITLAVLEAGAALVNPFPPNQPTVRALLDLALRPAVKTAVEGIAPDVEYLVDAIPRDTAPILSFSVSSTDVDQLAPAYDALIVALGVELADLQRGANVGSDLTVLQTLVPPTEVERSSASIVRSAVALALLGIAAATALAVAVDGALIRYRSDQGQRLATRWNSEFDTDPPEAPTLTSPDTTFDASDFDFDPPEAPPTRSSTKRQPAKIETPEHETPERETPTTKTVPTKPARNQSERKQSERKQSAHERTAPNQTSPKSKPHTTPKRRRKTKTTHPTARSANTR